MSAFLDHPVVSDRAGAAPDRGGVCCLRLRPGAALIQMLVLKSDIRVRTFGVDDEISREKLRDLLLRVRSSAMTHLVLMTSHRLARLVLDQVTSLFFRK